MFIKTDDEETYKKLLKLGFTYLHKEEKFYCFVNNGKQDFDENDFNKIIYTNLMNC